MSRQFSSDFLIEVQKGNVSGHSIIHKFGANTVVGTSYVPVAAGGDYVMLQPAAATALRVKAGNTNDTAAGSGAREVTIEGLDETGAKVQVALATAGTSASSATSETFIRLYRMWVSASGTYATMSAESHAAGIVIENGAGGTDWGTITTGGSTQARGQSEIGWYGVPTGSTAYVLSAKVFTDTARTTNILFFQRTSILDAAVPYDAFRLMFEISSQGGPVDLIPNSPFPGVVGPADIGFMAKVDASTAEVDVDFEILLIAN